MPFIYKLLPGCRHACMQPSYHTGGRPVMMRPLFQAFTGMSRYSRSSRRASPPPITLSKYSCASAKTSGSAPLCPPGPPALGREFRKKKAMMALAPAEIAEISDSMSLSEDSHDFSWVSQIIFPGPSFLALLPEKKHPVFPEGHHHGQGPAVD